jgi:hypothetical protein
MAWDENEVRTLLLDTEVPPSRLHVDDLLAAGQRSRRRWQRMTAAGAVAAAVLVAAPVVVMATGLWPGRPKPERPADFATTTVVTRRTGAVATGAACAAIPFRHVDAGDTGPIVDVDATGELAVGPARAGNAMTLWRLEQPAIVEFAEGSGAAVAVNAAGEVVGTGAGGNWIYRAGSVRRLPVPDGFAAGRVRDLNEVGDALGVLGWSATQLAASPLGLVVWPAEAPDRPRVIEDPNLRPVAIRDDGTVIALGTDADGATIVMIKADGSRRSVHIPAEVAAFDSDPPGFVRGDVLYASRVAGGPVRWNLRTGQIELFDDLSGRRVTAGTAGGWMMTTAGDETVAVAPDGTARRLPMPGSAIWVSAGGTVMIANTPTGPVTWRC